MTAPRRLSGEALDVLRACTVDGHVLYLPGQLQRRLYREVNDALSAIGGTWNRGASGHRFPFDPEPLLAALLKSKTLPPRNPGAFFPTPPEVAAQVIAAADLDPASEPLVLEPSAGQGSLVDALLTAVPTARPHLVEADPWNAELLRRRGWNVHEGDFLGFQAPQPYDAVVMNPPFSLATDRKAYITHIRHAWGMLADHGVLVAVAPRGFTFASDRRSREFLLEVQTYGEWSPLPDGAFATSGTRTSTVLLWMRRSDQSWRERAYCGWPSWHSWATNHIAFNEGGLYAQRAAIRSGVSSGTLTLNPTDPRWSETSRLIRCFYDAGVEAAHRAGEPVRPSATDLDHLVAHFVEEIRHDLLLEGVTPPEVDGDVRGIELLAGEAHAVAPGQLSLF
jgi:phospholipid N-methyltransferase